MNKIILFGNLTKDPELSHSGGGKAFCRFSLAVNDKFGEEERTDFFNVVAFGAKAEAISKYLKKGRKLLLEGKVKTGSYTNDNGETKKQFGVVLLNFNFVPDGKGGQPQSSIEQDEGSDFIPEDNKPPYEAAKPSDGLPF